MLDFHSLHDWSRMVTQERGRDNRMMQSSCEPIRDNSLSRTIMWSEDWVLASHSPSLVWNKNTNASEIGSRNFILCITYDVFHKFIELYTSKFCQTIQDSGQDIIARQASWKHILPKCRRQTSSLFLVRLLQHLLQPLSEKQSPRNTWVYYKNVNVTEITNAIEQNCPIPFCQLSKLTMPEFKSYLFVGLPVTPNTPFINELISTERSFMILSW